MIKFSNARKSISFFGSLRLNLVLIYNHRHDGDLASRKMTKAAAIEIHNWNRFYFRKCKDII